MDKSKLFFNGLDQGAWERSEGKYLSNVEKPEGRSCYAYIEMSARELH